MHITSSYDCFVTLYHKTSTLDIFPRHPKTDAALLCVGSQLYSKILQHIFSYDFIKKIWRKIVMQQFPRFTLFAKAHLHAFSLSKMHSLLVLHAKFWCLAIIHVILLNISDNYVGSYKFKIQKCMFSVNIFK